MWKIIRITIIKLVEQHLIKNGGNSLIREVESLLFSFLIIFLEFDILGYSTF